MLRIVPRTSVSCPRRTAAVLATTLALTGACGSGGSSAGPAPGSPDKVKVGVIAVVDVAPIYLGKQKGFFSRRNIDLALQNGSGGAITIAGVVSGQMQFGFANVTSLLVARDHGLPLKVVANGNSSTGVAGKDFSGVVVKPDSPIASARDLSGRSVSVNNLKNIGDTTIRASVRKAGGDPGTVKFVELAFPDAPAAVAGGRVDAAWVVEPFLTAALDKGLRVACWNMVEAAPNLTVATYFTTDKVSTDNPDLVRRFREAMNESLAYAQAHPDEARAVLATYTQISDAVRAKMTLPGWSTDIDRASIEQLAGLILGDGLIQKPADLNALLP
jgi:NitT/TauT family transport system substrate-binding protein